MNVLQGLKMNSSWPIGPNPSGNNSFPLMDPTNEYHQRNQQQAFHNNNNNNNDTNNDMKDHLIPGQESQNNFNQSQSGFQINQQQQQPAPVASPGAENSSPESKFNTDKFVNEIQVSQDLILLFRHSFALRSGQVWRQNSFAPRKVDR